MIKHAQGLGGLGGLGGLSILIEIGETFFPKTRWLQAAESSKQMGARGARLPPHGKVQTSKHKTHRYPQQIRLFMLFMLFREVLKVKYRFLPMFYLPTLISSSVNVLASYSSTRCTQSPTFGEAAWNKVAAGPVTCNNSWSMVGRRQRNCCYLFPNNFLKVVFCLLKLIKRTETYQQNKEEINTNPKCHIIDGGWSIVYHISFRHVQCYL